MLGFPILDCKGMRPMMFQLSGFCYRLGFKVPGVKADSPIDNTLHNHGKSDPNVKARIRGLINLWSTLGFKLIA